MRASRWRAASHAASSLQALDELLRRRQPARAPPDQPESHEPWRLCQPPACLYPCEKKLPSLHDASEHDPDDPCADELDEPEHDADERRRTQCPSEPRELEPLLSQCEKRDMAISPGRAHAAATLWDKGKEGREEERDGVRQRASAPGADDGRAFGTPPEGQREMRVAKKKGCDPFTRGQ